MRHSLDAKVRVARNAGFYTRFDTERPLELQKSPHETPCRGTAFGRTTWSARSLFLLTLFDPSFKETEHPAARNILMRHDARNRMLRTS